MGGYERCCRVDEVTDRRRGKLWLKCPHRKVEYYSSQFLTGHGSFRTFTFRIGKVPDENCIYCGEIDSPSHTIFEWIRWNRERTEFQLEYEGRINARNITREMVSWEIHSLIKIMEKRVEKVVPVQGGGVDTEVRCALSPTPPFAMELAYGDEHELPHPTKKTIDRYTG
ncbi:hypothetical protein JTB14_009577 [Gonioctena quinquepunctata]|nr:hypothetical protein JTB14_009577 [Gonioctena quinquepunctata]